MRMKKLAIVAVCLFSFPLVASAQLRDQPVDVAKALKSASPKNIISLLGLDAQKFSMNHSFSLGFSSLGGGSALYLNTMQYRFSNPLTLFLQVGIQSRSLGGRSMYGSQRGQMFVSGAGLSYKPSDNFGLYFESSQAQAASTHTRSPFSDPLSRNRAGFEHEDKDKNKDKDKDTQ